MFELIQSKLVAALSSLTGKGLLTEADVDAALRDVRVGLLEADVALPVIAEILSSVRTHAVGEKVLKGLNPGQQVIKLVYDALLQVLGAPGALAVKPQAGQLQVVVLAGLQGSGKTTTTGKLARLLQQAGHRVGVASVDVARPAAIDQLATLAAQAGVWSYTGPETNVLSRTQAALAAAKQAQLGTLLLDTAGRLQVDTQLMAELHDVVQLAQPVDTLLVVDGQTGQIAVQVAESFKAQVPLTGLVLTRMDGDARGGAAISLRHTTQVPIVYLGQGEKLDALEAYRPEGLAGRILGQGDVVALATKLQDAQNAAEQQQLEAKLLGGQGLDFNDIKQQLGMVSKLGGLAGLASYLPSFVPGLGQLGGQLNSAKMDPKILKRQQALIDSMTPAERRNPGLLNARRRLRIAKGAGQDVADLNKLVTLLTQLNQMAKLMKGKGLAGALGGAGGAGGAWAGRPRYGGHSASLQKLLRR